MSFELRPDKSVGKNLRRIVRKQIDLVLQELTPPAKGHRDEVVHELRKSLKKIRALLRLVRPSMGEKVYRRENTCFRDAARPLAEVRDARILIETLHKLVEHFREHIAGRSFVEVRKALQDNLRAVRKRVLDQHNGLAVVAETVSQARGRVKGWTDVPDKWSFVGGGLQVTCRQARAAFREAAADPCAAKLHEWRKQVKYLRYQLEVFRPLWPERMKELADEAGRLGDLLGDDHDLVLLRQTLGREPRPVADDGERETLVALIDRRRVELEKEALSLGKRFFQDKPRELARRFKGYWKMWRGQTSLVGRQVWNEG